MSLAGAQQRSPRRPGPADMSDGVARRGMALSGALHLVLIALLIFGLPSLFSPPPPQEMPIAVDLVDIGPETRATHPNPNPPQHAAKPVEPVPGPAAAEPEHKPEPPQPTVPASAAAAPTPEPPVHPEPKPVPTPSPPLPQAKPQPPPEPVEKVAAPRPQEKLEPPKKALDAARAQASKYDPGQFDTLLRNLAADNPPSPDEPPRKSSTVTGTRSSQPKAPLGSRLSASEIDMVREQISRCWNVPAGARDASDLIVEIRVVVSPDGNVQQARIVDQARVASDPFFRAAAESARRAFFNPECRPLHLPADKYDLWRDMVVDFTPKDLS
jgi:outer membrane biosynthesis protein TonB